MGVVLDYFRDMFTFSCTKNFQNILGVVNGISLEDNNFLTRQIDKDEVWGALKAMHPSKSPGPDGFAPCFY